MFTKLWRRTVVRTHRPAHDRGQPRPPRLGCERLEDRALLSADVILQWNELLMQSLTSQPPRVPLSRNMALVHVAMFDAVNAIDRSYEPYDADVHASRGASPEAAAAQAAHDTLVALYPSRQAIFDARPGRGPGGHPPRPGQAGRRGRPGGRPTDPGPAQQRRLQRRRHLHAEQRPRQVSANPAELRPGRQRARRGHHPVRGRQ